MIIDGSSCNNLASSEMVEKLSLTTKPHPHPYYIQWLNSSGKAKVTKLVRINFTIGSYHDVVECDVVPMQACNIPLGRPCNMIEIQCIMVDQINIRFCTMIRK